MSKILICGATSFVAKGLAEILRNEGHEIDLFSRGDILKNGNVITGDYLTIANNEYLAPEYDSVVNYSVIKDGTV